jgi:hypothetical protein
MIRLSAKERHRARRACREDRSSILVVGCGAVYRPVKGLELAARRLSGNKEGQA